MEGTLLEVSDTVKCDDLPCQPRPTAWVWSVRAVDATSQLADWLTNVSAGFNGNQLTRLRFARAPTSVHLATFM